jgi:subtilisin-like proprotein convertase family protein
VETPKAFTTLFLTVGLLACFVATSLAVSKSRPVPGKSSGYPARTGVPGRGYQPSLDNLYTSTDVPVDIPDGPDGDTAVSVLTIPDDVIINDMNVMVSITHSWIRDLRISLVAPNDSELVLLDLLPQDDAVNMTDTWFNDEAQVPIDSGVPPFTGSYRPQHALSMFDGANAQGTWTLRVLDRFYLDTGTIDAWAIEVNPPVALAGTVRDQFAHSPIARARIGIVETGQHVLTNTQGWYGFEDLSGGTYSVQFTGACYDTLAVDSVTIVSGQTTTLDTSLAASATQVLDLASQGSPVSIPDYPSNGASFSMTVNQSDVICDLDVTVNVTHPWVGDLELWLIGPASDTVQLVFVGDSCLDLGANIVNCRFDDEATQAFSEGSAPFTGSWRPYQPLSAFDNTQLQGQWSLRARDNCEGDIGSIQNFTLHVTTALSTGVGDTPPALPRSFVFYGNFPNPFNASTNFRFDLAREQIVNLTLFDLTGREVTTIISGAISPGEHTITFDAGSLPSGLYVARLSAGGQSQSHKILLLK